MNQTHQKFNTLMMWVLFIIYPLFACVLAVKKFQYKKYRIFILLFFMLFGYTFIPIPESDGDFYKSVYQDTDMYAFDDYKNDVLSLYKGESVNPDIYIETVKFLSFLISTNYKFFFLLVALIYFFVAIKLVGSIHDFVIDSNTKNHLVFFIGIITIFSISFGLNGIRFPLAFWVFSYGAFNLIVTEKIKYLLIALSASLIHFSLFYSFVFLCIYYVFRFFNLKPNKLYLILIATIFFSNLFPDLIASYLNFFGETYSAKVVAYTNENYIETREAHVKKWNWYIQLNQVSTYYFCIFSVIMTKSKLFSLQVNQTSNNLFKFSMFMLIATILSGTLVDSISNRYYLLFNLFALIYLFHLSTLNFHHLFMKFLRTIYLPILILHVLIMIRVDLYTINSTLVFGNAVSVFLVDSSISIYQLLFG